MKSTVSRTVSLIMAIAVLAMALTSCSKLKKMKYNENGQLCYKTATYNYAPPGYEPTSQGEAYGLIDSVMQDTLYTIGDADPEQWLTTEYCGAATMVYYSADITLPTLSEMDPEICYFCETGSNGVIALYELGQEDIDKISTIVEMLGDDSAENEMWPRADTVETYQLKFYSPDWPTVYYNVVYGVCTSGNYVWDRVNDRCVLIGDILSEFHESTADTDISA